VANARGIPTTLPLNIAPLNKTTPNVAQNPVPPQSQQIGRMEPPISSGDPQQPYYFHNIINSNTQVPTVTRLRPAASTITAAITTTHRLHNVKNNSNIIIIMIIIIVIVIIIIMKPKKLPTKSQQLEMNTMHRQVR
jgi:hypothetical protein